MRRTLPISARLLDALPLLAALALRLALWGSLPRTGLISDEGEYLSAAQWLVDGRGFDWYQGYLWTRAPLYPLFVAAHLRLFGAGGPWLAISQTAISLASVALVMALARRLEPCQPWLPRLAGLLAGLYLPLALYAQLALSETLFIGLLLGALLALSGRPLSLRHVLAAGALLGLATLTRSLALGFLPIAVLWLLLAKSYRTAEPQALNSGQAASEHPRPGDLPSSIAQRSPSELPPAASQRLMRAAAFTLAAGLVILPWTIYSSRSYGGVVLIDTSGAFNLLLGARTAYDGKRSDAQVRDYVLGLLGQPTSAPISDTCAPFPGALASQAARQAAMTREGLCLLAARPAAFAGKAAAELIDLFQINYTGAERFTDGFSTGRLAPAYVLALFVLDDTLYVLALPLAVAGWALAHRRASPLVGLAGLWWLYSVATAPLLFAINRFRIPLMPLGFIFAAYAMLRLAGWLRAARGRPDPHAPAEPPGQRSFNLLCAMLALTLLLLATTPYAYLEPRQPGADSRWASYLGPYPSSLDITLKSLAARPHYLRDQRFAAALREGDLALAERLLREGGLGAQTTQLGPALLAARQGRYDKGLALLPVPEAIAERKDALAAVVRGDLLRSLGEQPAALATLSARYVDDANPVGWAWDWLAPAPARRINLGGSLDLGYINGCYLGEGDTTLAEPANFRWCTDGALLRFPGAGSGAAQTLVLRVDGRAWRSYGMPPPEAQVWSGGRLAGAFAPDPHEVREFHIALPPAPQGATVEVVLRTPTLVPDAARYNSQQGEAVAGQVQRLGLRIDWAEIR